MIEVDSLVKQYDELVAVSELDLVAKPGEVFGLLGPNGAGKSTTISCISGLVAPTRGTVRVNGHDIQREPKAAKTGLGVVPQDLALYEDLSAAENVRFWAGIHGLGGKAAAERAAEVLSAVGLADRGSEPVKNFSGGMKRRLNFACGIVHRPTVLLLDEPTVGVDPQSRVHLLELVAAQRDTGTAVLYTTHYMEEASALCDRLAIVDGGKKIAEGDLDELRRLVGERDLVLLGGRFEDERLAPALAGLADAELIQLSPERLHLAVADAPRRLAEVLSLVSASGGDVTETTVRRADLESLFIKLTGRELRE
ncbi:MAG: ABC transporter ATP-binding protein [Planctomycetota bacterium]|nr:ABC transporter ATP-binding protein [Planctomycetota bacterium]